MWKYWGLYQGPILYQGPVKDCNHPKPWIPQPPSSPVALVVTPLIELGNAHVSTLARAKALLQVEYLGPCSITEQLLVLS